MSISLFTFFKINIIINEEIRVLSEILDLSEDLDNVTFSASHLEYFSNFFRRLTTAGMSSVNYQFLWLQGDHQTTEYQFFFIKHRKHETDSTKIKPSAIRFLLESEKACKLSGLKTIQCHIVLSHLMQRPLKSSILLGSIGLPILKVATYFLVKSNYLSLSI